MKKAFISLIFTLISSSVLFAQSGFEFKDVVRLKTTSVKNQEGAGTCWSWSACSFLESEMIRTGKKDVADLSAMYVVRKCYSEKAEKAVRMHGKINYDQGGATYDVFYTVKKYGITPLEIYEGKNYGTDRHLHSEMTSIFKAYVNAVIKNANKKLTPVWKVGLNATLDAYLGKAPEKFTYKGKEYTPQSFAKDYVGLNMDDYIQITSYTHHPFYSKFIMEVPDNWLWGSVYNVKIDELEKIMDNALKKGYTIAWASDVSEKGFSHSKGVAVIPEVEIKNMTDSERAKWENVPKKEILSLDKPMPEKNITQEMRQDAFDNYSTTDDHGLHIIGIAKDQNGKEYYIVKNSWGTNSRYKGYFYASKSFILYKTMSFAIHKDALPTDIRKKLSEKNPELR